MPPFASGAASRTWLAGGSDRGSNRANSSRAPSGAPESLWRPIVRSCSPRAARSHASISIRIRRATRYVPCRSHAGSPARSPATQTCAASAAASSALRFAVPSLKPMRLRGVACARLVDDVRPNPSCDQRTVTTPRPIRARLRTAWKATCGSSAHAWTQRSPPLRAGSSSSPGSGGSGASAGGRWAASPKRASNSAGPNPNVTVSRAGGQADRLAGVLRRGERSRRAAQRPAARHRRRGRRPGAHQLAQVARPRARGEVEGGEVQPILRGRGDPRLHGAVERDDLAVAARRARRRGRARSPIRRRRRRPRRRRASRAAGGASAPSR